MYGHINLTLADFSNPFYPIWFTCSQKPLNYLAFQSLTFRISDEGYSRHASCVLICVLSRSHRDKESNVDANLSLHNVYCFRYTVV
jgi:hypothetical protein